MTDNTDYQLQDRVTFCHKGFQVEGWIRMKTRFPAWNKYAVQLGTYKDGTLVDAGTSGAVRPPAQPMTGTQAQNMLNGQTPPGMNPSSRQAYVNYIRRLQQGTAGFTCYASLQNPRG